MNRVIILTLGILLLLWPASQAQAQAQVDLDAFGQLPVIQFVRISPNGQKVASVRRIKGKQALVVQDLAGGEPAVIGLGDHKVRGVRWANDEYAMVTVSATDRVRGFGSKFEMSGVYSVDVNSGAITPLMNNNRDTAIQISISRVLATDWQGDGSALMPAQSVKRNRDGAYDVFKVSMKTGYGKIIARGSSTTADWLIGPDGKVALRLNSDYSVEKLKVMKKVGKGWQEILTLDTKKGAGYVGGFTADGKGLVVFGHFGGDKVIAKLLPLDGNGEMEDLFSVDEVDLGGPIRDPYNNTVVGIYYTKDWSTYHFFDQELARQQAKLQKAFKKNHVTLVSWNAARTRFIIEVEGIAESGTYYLYDKVAKKASALGYPYPQITPDVIAPRRPYAVHTRDGETIPAYLTLPRVPNPTNLPLVILPHGGPEARDSMGFDWWSQAMAARGYAVLQPNYRGSDGYGIKFRDAGRKQWGQRSQNDMSDGVLQLIKEGVVDPKRVCIVGASYGGYAAMAGITFTPDLYKCAVAVAGVSDLPKMQQWVKRNGGAFGGGIRYWNKVMGQQGKDDAMLAAYSPARHADKVKGSLLLIHGTDDTVVPFEQSKILLAALKAKHKDVRLEVLGSEDHWLSREPTRKQLIHTIDAYLAEHIGPNAAP